MKRRYQILFGLFISINLHAQNDSLALQQAKGLYESGNYAECIESIDAYLQNFEAEPEVLKMRGNCYLELNQLPEAQANYKAALAIEPNYGPALYNLGHTMEERGRLDSAALYFKLYSDSNPEDANALMRLAGIFRITGGSESPLSLLEKAYGIDSNDASIHFYLIQEYLFQEDTLSSLLTLRKALDKFPMDVDFDLLFSRIEIDRGNFASAKAHAQNALSKDSSLFYAYRLEIEATFLDLCDEKLIKRLPSGRFAFSTYSSDQTGQLAKEFKKEYPSLKGKLQAGEILALNEYLKFYLGQSNEGEYQPYGLNHSEEVREYWQNENFTALASMDSLIWESNPLDLSLFYKLAIANFQLGNFAKFKSLYSLYLGHIMAIIASGDGLDYATAYIVTTTSNQYELLSYLGLRSQGQALVNDGGHSYDLQKCIDAAGNNVELYFNIDLPFNSLRNTFDED